VLDDDTWALVEPLLAAARGELARVRAEPELSNVDDWRRAQLLWALQYDRRPGDLPLLRVLLRQEVAVCESGGGTDETYLASYLVSLHRSPDDVWLLYDLKRANYDTHFEVDVEHLLTGGVASTLDAVHDDPYLVRELAGRTDAEVDAWLARRAGRFPTEPRQESPQTWLQRALTAGARDTARTLLDRWTLDRPERQSDRRWYLEHVFGEFGAAAALQSLEARSNRDPFGRASARIRLAGLQRRAGNPLAAWEALRRDTLPPRLLWRWRHANLARDYVAELFLLVPLIPRGRLARQVFDRADRSARVVADLHRAGLLAAVAAAEHVRDNTRRQRYQMRLRIDCHRDHR
jgi:hypothetical protein